MSDSFEDTRTLAAKRGDIGGTKLKGNPKLPMKDIVGIGGKKAAGASVDIKARRQIYKDLMLDHVPTAINTLVDVMSNSDNDTARVSAARSYIESCLGRPAHTVERESSVPMMPIINIISGNGIPNQQLVVPTIEVEYVEQEQDDE